MLSSLIPRRGPARPSASRLAVCAGAATIALLVGGVVVPGAASADPAADLQSPPTAADQQGDRGGPSADGETRR